ncbi:hypothetical protein BU14_0194s0002 [Porphyra umbilicalis]|uniref:Uncharacterized protein n=1 Tax=Porphyra umbilicalis TaxID=2786 RepID=A0A1X6P6V0_PORUM|nr:hypothetical protein BU14_0194s0002 [Porphyra umbilicalis]|eukprot:OSX76363.1 hypothetical protein BU14_0194s0002 [Porphyra umbilicalis]
MRPPIATARVMRAGAVPSPRCVRRATRERPAPPRATRRSVTSSRPPPASNTCSAATMRRWAGSYRKAWWSSSACTTTRTSRRGAEWGAASTRRAQRGAPHRQPLPPAARHAEEGGSGKLLPLAGRPHRRPAAEQEARHERVEGAATKAPHLEGAECDHPRRHAQFNGVQRVAFAKGDDKRQRPDLRHGGDGLPNGDARHRPDRRERAPPHLEGVQR